MICSRYDTETSEAPCFGGVKHARVCMSAMQGHGLKIDWPLSCTVDADSGVLQGMRAKLLALVRRVQARMYLGGCVLLRRGAQHAGQEIQEHGDASRVAACITQGQAADKSDVTRAVTRRRQRRLRPQTGEDALLHGHPVPNYCRCL